MKLQKSESPGRTSLIYHPSKVAWATAEFIRKPPALASRVYIYLLTISIVGAFIYSGLSILAVTIDSPGRLVTEKALYMLKAPATFRISKLNVEKNKEVKKGDILVIGEDQISEAEYALLKKHSDYLKDILTKDKEGRCGNCLGDLTLFNDYAFQVRNKGQIRETISPIQDQLKDFVAAKTNLSKIDLSTASLKRQITISEQKLNSIRKQKAEKLLGDTIENLTSEITQAKAQIADKQQSLDAQVVQSRGRLETRLQGLMTTVDQYRESNQIISPIDGTVSDLKISGPGIQIGLGQEVVEVIPKNSKLVAELKVANKDISQIRVGMEAKIKLDALSEREYGAVDGKVEVVPVNITQGQQQGAQSTYDVIVSLNTQSLTKNGVEYPFRLGMTLNGLIVTKRETMLKIGIKKLLNVKDELVGN